MAVRLRFAWLYAAFAVLITLLPLVVVSLVWFTWSRTREQAEARGAEAARVHGAAAIVDAVASERIHRLEAIARRIGRASVAERPALLASLLSQDGDDDRLPALSVIDGDGTVQVAAGTAAVPQAEQRYAAAADVREALASRHTVVSTILADPRLLVTVVTPLDDDGPPSRLLAMRLDLADLASRALAAHGSLPASQLFFLDQSGQAFRLAAGGPPVPQRRADLLPAMGAANGWRRTRAANEDRLLTWEALPALRLTVALETPLAALVVTGRPSLARRIAVATGLVLLASIGLSLLGGRYLNRELRVLREHLRSLEAASASQLPPSPALRVAELIDVAADARAMARAIKGRQDELEALYQLDRALARAHGPDELARVAIEHVLPLLGFDAAAVFATREQRLTPLYLHNVPPPLTIELERPDNDAASLDPIALALANGRPVIVPSTSTAIGPGAPLAQAITASGFVTVAATPLLAHGQVFGAIALFSRRAMPSSPRAVSLLVALGVQLGVAVSHAAETERLAAQQRLAALGRLAAGVAHELKNPLAVVAARVQLMGRQLAAGQLPASNTLSHHVTRLTDAAARMQAIIEGLSSYSKPSKREPALLNMAALLSATRELVGHHARKHHVKVTVDAPAIPPPVWGDRTQVMQILLNLANNAIDAMAADGGALRMKVEARDWGISRIVAVDISDTGPGIPAERLATIWDPFYTTKPEGTGLGLSIVRSLVRELPGASIDVDSTPGIGTMFMLRLPVAHVDPAASADDPSPGA